nr:MAG TPA: hypothetical protein [Caudoviricetes sp.]
MCEMLTCIRQPILKPRRLCRLCQLFHYCKLCLLFSYWTPTFFMCSLPLT